MPPKLDLSQRERAKLRMRGYEVGDTLGNGSFGTVHKASIEVVPCAVKCLSLNKDNLTSILTEIYSLKNIKHQHVIQVHELIVNTKKQLLVFMELAEGGDLDHFIWKKVPMQPIPESTSKLLYRQFGDAFRFMHQLGIAHQDIKPANILLDASKTVCKVSDFGLARIGFDPQSGQSCLANTYRDSAYFVAPEVTVCYLAGYQYCPFKADVWSVGVMLFEMLNRSKPFEYLRVDPITGRKVSDYEWLVDSQVNMDYTIKVANLSREARGIIRMHLEPNPLMRPNFQQIFEFDTWLKINEQ